MLHPKNQFEFKNNLNAPNLVSFTNFLDRESYFIEKNGFNRDLFSTVK